MDKFTLRPGAFVSGPCYEDKHEDCDGDNCGCECHLKKHRKKAEELMSKSMGELQGHLHSKDQEITRLKSALETEKRLNRERDKIIDEMANKTVKLKSALDAAEKEADRYLYLFRKQVSERYKLIIKIKDKAREHLSEEELNFICKSPETRIEEYLKACALHLAPEERKSKECPSCEGKGSDGYGTCMRCGGTGEWEQKP